MKDARHRNHGCYYGVPITANLLHIFRWDFNLGCELNGFSAVVLGRGGTMLWGLDGNGVMVGQVFMMLRLVFDLMVVVPGENG